MKIKTKFNDASVKDSGKGATGFHQRGLTVPGVVFALILATFALMVTFKIGPMYLDNLTVKSSFDGLANENLREMRDSQIRRKLNNYFIVNNVRDIKAKEIKITRERTKIIVSHEYEKRAQFIGNLDVVARFSYLYDSSKE